jgi:hypothetical protein
LGHASWGRIYGLPMRHHWRECDIPGIFLCSARACCARNSARLRLAGCSFPLVPEMYVYFLVNFFIVSILIAGMASKQGSINFGQKRKASEPDNLFVNNVSVPRRGRATPPPKPPFLCLQFCLCSCFYFCPKFSFMLPLKTLPIFSPFFPLPIFVLGP